MGRPEKTTPRKTRIEKNWGIVSFLLTAKESWSQKKRCQKALGRETTCLASNNEEQARSSGGVPSESLEAQSGLRVTQFLVKRSLIFEVATKEILKNKKRLLQQFGQF